jgi:hypothetical protein
MMRSFDGGELRLQLEETAFVDRFHQLMHEPGRREEGDREAALAGGEAEHQTDMRLAGSAVAEGDDVVAGDNILVSRASSRTSGLLSDGMAAKSNVSKLFTAGKRPARMRRSTMRRSRSMSSSSARRTRKRT